MVCLIVLHVFFLLLHFLQYGHSDFLSELVADACGKNVLYYIHMYSMYTMGSTIVEKCLLIMYPLKISDSVLQISKYQI